MRLAVIRHAAAVERGAWDGLDAERPLTQPGAERFAGFARRVHPLAEGIGLIAASPWRRAAETAAILSRTWSLPVLPAPWLAGEMLDPAAVAARIPTGVGAALVGHEPALSGLIGWLTGGGRVALKKGACALLVGDPVAGGMRLRWLLAPKHADALA